MPVMHPYNLLHLPSDAPFKLQPSPGKGWGAFATRRIERGEVILREEALFVIRKADAEITHDDILAAVAQLSIVQQQQFLLLHDVSSQSFDHIRRTFDKNHFSFHIEGETLALAQGCFPLLSRFNNSCSSNSHVLSSAVGSNSSFALRSIQPGTSAHDVLGFICTCAACLPGTSFRKCSDMRRRLLRGLRYLTSGSDLHGVLPNGCPIIVDPELKQAAEQFKIPVSSRLVYIILMHLLMVAEGLWDNVELEERKPAVDALASCIQSKSNLAVASLVIRQNTWMKKLDAAFRLYGIPDDADDWISRVVAQA